MEFPFVSGLAGGVAGLALLFALSNGFRDASTIVATVVSTRTVGPTAAFGICAAGEVTGLLLLGSGIAQTIGLNFINPDFHQNRGEILLVIGAALAAAVIWGGISWWRAWPTSNNQALVAGLIGASLAVWGTEAFQLKTVVMLLGFLILSPLLGFVLSTVVTMLLRKAGEWMTPRAEKLIDRMHMGSLFLVSLAHGSNDGQIVLGLLVLVTGVAAGSAAAAIPFSLRVPVAIAIAGGVLIGGRRILARLGMNFFHIRKTQGLGSQLASAVTILGGIFGGFPASTTQVITGSIVGAGVAKNPKAVRWHEVRGIAFSWAITMPVMSALAAALCFIARMG